MTVRNTATASAPPIRMTESDNNARNRTRSAGGLFSGSNTTVTASVPPTAAATSTIATNNCALVRATYSPNADRPALTRRVAAHARGTNASPANTSSQADWIANPLPSRKAATTCSGVLSFNLPPAISAARSPARNSTANAIAHAGTIQVQPIGGATASDVLMVPPPPATRVVVDSSVRS